jgi:hypothetical protein
MKNRDFIPYQSFGSINFGDKLDEVRKRLNAVYSQVYFSPESNIFHDYYDDLGFKIEYDATNTVLSVETFNDMNFPVKFLGKNLTSLTYSQLEHFFKENDPNVEPFSIGFYSPKFGISICFENFEDSPDETTTSFHIVRKDYMDLNR